MRTSDQRDTSNERQARKYMEPYLRGTKRGEETCGQPRLTRAQYRRVYNDTSEISFDSYCQAHH